MDDLISRHAAIKEIIETYEYEFPTASGAFDEFATKIVPNVLKNLPSAQQWIPCSERLPEKHKTVLITHRGGVSFGWHNGKHWERGASQNHRPLQTVVAWMPLPEPYKEEQTWA